MKFIFNMSLSKDEIAVTILPTIGYNSFVEEEEIKERFKKKEVIKTTKRSVILHWLVWGICITF